MNVLVEKEEKNKGCCKDTCKIAWKKFFS
jgi:hypothetical protein